MLDIQVAWMQRTLQRFSEEAAAIIPEHWLESDDDVRLWLHHNSINIITSCLDHFLD